MGPCLARPPLRIPAASRRSDSTAGLRCFSMVDDTRTGRPTKVIASIAIAAAAIAVVVLVALSARYPLPVLLGVRPLPLFLGVASLVALVVAALLTDPSSRHP